MAKKKTKKKSKKKSLNWVQESAKDIDTAFRAGADHGRSDANTHAFYVGVGYGKAMNGHSVVGFRNTKEHEAFRRGSEQHNKYFISESNLKKNWFEKFLDFFTPSEGKRSVRKNEKARRNYQRAKRKERRASRKKKGESALDTKP